MRLRILILFCLALGFVLPSGNANGHSAPDLLLNYHFLGTKNLFSDTNTAKLKQLWSLPTSIDMKEQALDKLAHLAPRMFTNSSTRVLVITNLIRPLLDDLVECESFVEVRRGTNGPGEIVLAIRVNEERSGVWNSNVLSLAESWSGEKSVSLKEKEFTGWEIKRKEAPNLIRFGRTKDWVIVGIGQKELPLHQNVVKAISKGGAPVKFTENSWLEADIDWSRINSWIPLKSSPFKLARTQLTLSSKADYVRTVVRAVYPEKIKHTDSAWKIPTDLVKDPVISFTAAQDLGVILNTPPELNRIGVNPFERQAYLWAVAGSPFHSFMAVESKDAKQDLQQLRKTLPATFNQTLAQKKAGAIAWDTNKNQLIWLGMPVLAPFVRATNMNEKSYVFGGLFPPLPLTNAAPQELFQQVTSKKNLVYYDWELTQDRLSQWQMLSQILPFPRPTPSANVPRPKDANSKTNAFPKLGGRLLEQRWISAIGSKLGNTVTEVAQTGANELTLSRKSHAGFTAFELVMVARWLTSENFPFFHGAQTNMVPAVPPVPTRK